jgi:hypothetical protein
MKTMKTIWATFGIGLILIVAIPCAWASEVDALINKLIEKGILTSEEAQEIRNEMSEESQTVAKVREVETKEVVKKMEGGSWLDKVKWNADLRLRHESQLREPAPDRHRERFRLRFGFTAKPMDPLEIGVRLATGASGDPVSTNQTFTNTFDKKPIFVDRAYGKFTPWAPLSLIGGKMDIPFETVNEGIVWDHDVTPEGVAIRWKSPISLPFVKTWLPIRPFANVGAFQISELNGDTGDPAVFGFQGGADVDLPWGLNGRWSAAYYDFTAIEGANVSNVTNAPSGNSTVTKGTARHFRFDYNLVSMIWRIGIPEIFKQPVELVGEWTRNPAAQDDNGAWMAGIEVGKVTEKLGSWKASYFFKRLEPDATFGAIADSDFGAGGTNHKGHIFGLQVGLNKYMKAGLKYFRTDEVEGSQNKVNTFQADLETKF